MQRDIQKASQLYMLPRVAGSAVPVPGDGPVLFQDSGNADQVTAKMPSGISAVLGAQYMSDAKMLGAKGDTIQTTATISAAATTATVADALSSTDVGKVISIAAAGDGADLVTTIEAVSDDGLTVTVADAATDGGTDAVTFVGTSDVSALTDADTAAGSDGTLLVPPGMYLVDDDLTLSAGTVKVMRGVSFVVLEGFTLSFAGYVEAAPNQVPLLLDADCEGAIERAVPNVMTGAGSPESAVVGIIGDAYTALDGTTDTTLWTKESGANTDTGWVANEAPA